MSAESGLSRRSVSRLGSLVSQPIRKCEGTTCCFCVFFKDWVDGHDMRIGIAVLCLFSQRAQG
jgi:hypothetical protein